VALRRFPLLIQNATRCSKQDSACPRSTHAGQISAKFVLNILANRGIYIGETAPNDELPEATVGWKRETVLLA
jgi:hypothetical protein